MESIQQYHSFPFLKGGGEMGELTRAYNWKDNILGSPGQWPKSLQQTVSIVLSSRFPMFIWWGDQMIQFYNDAYRPSLGQEGKHPAALGQSGPECWPEIWPIIYPLIENVMQTGEPAWMENQLIPIYRNGSLEDVYWTFSYSLILNDEYEPGGILVTCMETTEAVQGHKRIEESEERFRTMAEGTDILIAVADETSNAVYFNKAWEDLTGRPRANLLNFGWTDLVHPEDREKYLKAYFAAFEKRVPFSEEFRVKTPGGDYRWLLARVQPRFLSDQSFAGYISSCMDITDRKSSEKYMEESESKFRNLIEEASVASCLLVGPELRMEIANKTMLDYVGKDRSIIGMPLVEGVPELASQSFINKLLYVINTGQVIEEKEAPALLEVNGMLNTYYFDYTYKPVKNRFGEVYAVMDTAIDVTKQVLARKALEQSERNLRKTILQSPVAMCILRGPDLVIEIANDPMLELWDKSSQDAMGKPVFELIADRRNQHFEESLRYVFSTGETFIASEQSTYLERKGKRENIYLDLMFKAFREADGSISGIIGVAHEVTAQVLARRKIEEVVADRTAELAKANEALVRSNQELNRSNANLEEFAHAASHDLKEPIRKIYFFTQQLKEQLAHQVSEAELRAFNRIENATERMGKLIDDLLLYSHVSQRPHEKERSDLNQTVQHVLDVLELEIQEKKALINLNELPVVYGYERQLQQMFQNLLSNALKYCKATEAPRINIQSHSIEQNDQQFHVIEVKDNGIGFEQQYADRIFQMFSRLHGRTEYGGTGVGLAIVKKVLQNHNGYIEVNSAVGEGSSFKVFLPAEC